MRKRSDSLAFRWSGFETASRRPGSVSSASFSEGRRFGGRFCQHVQEGRLVDGLHVVVVPEARSPDTVAAAVEAQPAWRCRVDRLLPEVAEQRNRVSLDHASQARCAREVVDTYPHERHRADDAADGEFGGALLLANAAWYQVEGGR